MTLLSSRLATRIGCAHISYEVGFGFITGGNDYGSNTFRQVITVHYPEGLTQSQAWKVVLEHCEFSKSQPDRLDAWVREGESCGYVSLKAGEFYVDITKVGIHSGYPVYGEEANCLYEEQRLMIGWLMDKLEKKGSSGA